MYVPSRLGINVPSTTRYPVRCSIRHECAELVVLVLCVDCFFHDHGSTEVFNQIDSNVRVLKVMCVCVCVCVCAFVKSC